MPVPGSTSRSVAVCANLNKFGNPDAAPATKVKFQRISQPVLAP